LTLESFVTIKLSVSETNLILEKLKNSQKLAEDHGKLKAESTEMEHRQRKSREDALRLADIISKIEG